MAILSPKNTKQCQFVEDVNLVKASVYWVQIVNFKPDSNENTFTQILHQGIWVKDCSEWPQRDFFGTGLLKPY